MQITAIGLRIYRHVGCNAKKIALMNKVFLLILICISTVLSGQNVEMKDRFIKEITRVKGDLNKDGISDLVIVTQDTIEDTSPYRLQIYFGQPNGRFKLIDSTEKVIQPEFNNGKDGYKHGNGFSEITIKNGVLSINNLLLRGHFEHKYRFQNGHFELIGFSMVCSDGRGVMTTTDFNLLTGIRIEKSERYDTTQILSDTKKKILIRPLPKLGGFELFNNELY